MVPRKLYAELGGLDAETFFLYCDDVDFSWRLRLAGYTVVHRRSAPVFHDKRLNKDGGWMPTPAERYYSAEAALLLAFKYSRPDICESHFDNFIKSEDETLLKAAAAFELRRKTGRLPIPIDADHRVAEFIDGNYGPRRFTPRF
jgi:GT2 family glycosyltransferase